MPLWGPKAFQKSTLFLYASALEKTKRLPEAVVWYEKFLKKSADNDSVDFMREVAQDKIKELKK